MIIDREITDLKKKIELIEERVTKLEVEEVRETKEGTIREGIKRGPKK